MAKLIPQTILETADSRPEREAACFLDERISYGQLATQVGKLASVLADQGVRSGDRVGIFMDKSLLLPTTMHGIMHAGGAYVPLDPAAPPDRLASILQDCDIRVLVTATNKARTLRSLMKRQTPLERLIGAGDDLALPNISWDDVGTAPCDLSPHPGTGENDLAYIIYTSGSTGVPKGIMHTHYSGLSFASWAAREYGLHYTDRLSNHAPLHFDLSIFDYFAGAVAGATTVIVPEEYVKLAASYSTYLSEQSVSVLFTVPFALMQLLQRGLLEQRDLSALRWVIFGGEPFPTKHLRDLMAALPHARFDNMYGPAEVNGCTHFTVPRGLTSEDPVPIGRIADIAEQLVVDNQGAVVAAGEIGELLVRTPTMMKGYWGRPDLNETSFYQRHAENRNPDVFYRTGDLVRQESDGILHFIGRKDRQIKVRGYRVELDEIEAALTATNGVADSAVFAVPDGAGSQSIHAAFLPQADVVLTAEEILARLKKLLPRYAVPTTVLCREEFPRTSTGKIDRLRLREQALEAEQPQ